MVPWPFAFYIFVMLLLYWFVDYSWSYMILIHMPAESQKLNIWHFGSLPRHMYIIFFCGRTAWYWEDFLTPYKPNLQNLLNYTDKPLII
jgi:hypothetical protein